MANLDPTSDSHWRSQWHPAPGVIYSSFLMSLKYGKKLHQRTWLARSFVPDESHWRSQWHPAPGTRRRFNNELDTHVHSSLTRHTGQASGTRHPACIIGGGSRPSCGRSCKPSCWPPNIDFPSYVASIANGTPANSGLHSIRSSSNPWRLHKHLAPRLSKHCHQITDV